MIARFRPSGTVRLLYFAFACLAVALSLELIRRAIPGYLPRDWTAAHEYDALADWKAARLYVMGKSPYSPEGVAMIGQGAMGHPPTTPFWYLLLADFEKSVAAQLSSALLLMLLPLHTFLCAKALKFPVPVLIALVVSSAVAATAWFRYHYEVVQFSESIAFLYVLAWLCLRRGRDASAGVCLGAALTMKLFPGLLLLLLLAARRFRAFFAAAGTYLAIALVMTRMYGWASWLQYFREQKGISKDWLGSLQNSSLQGLVVRLITPACEAQGRPSKRATLIAVGLSLLLVASAVWFSRTHLARTRNHDRAIDLPFSLFVLLSAFLNAWAWEHYFVLTIQPLFVLLATFCSAFWTTLTRWCARRLPSRQLWAFSAMALIGVAGVALTCRVLSVNFQERDAMLQLWFIHRLPFYHHRMHWLEAANFASWMIPIALCFLALSLSRRVASEQGPWST